MTDVYQKDEIQPNDSIDPAALADSLSGAGNTDITTAGNVKSSFFKLISVVPFSFVIPASSIFPLTERSTHSFRHGSTLIVPFVTIVFNDVSGTGAPPIIVGGVSVNEQTFTLEVGTSINLPYTYNGYALIYELLIG